MFAGCSTSLYLAQAWIYKSGVSASFQTTPIVQNGVMYLSLPFNHVVALNAKTGQQLWRYQHDKRKDWQMCCGPANRGVAVANGKVFIGTVDARLIALNAVTGVKEWDINVVEGAIGTEGQDALMPSQQAREGFQQRLSRGPGAAQVP